MVTHPGGDALPASRTLDAAPEACMDSRVQPSQSKPPAVAPSPAAAGGSDVWSKQAAIVQVRRVFCALFVCCA
jgi:hypothetical protein